MEPDIMTHWDMSPIGNEICREGAIYAATINEPEAILTGDAI